MRLGASELAGRDLDRAAVAIARSRGAIELALGESLAQLFDGEVFGGQVFGAQGLKRLGYVRQVDYARERLGIPPRTMYGWVRLARAVDGRALLRRAVLDGSVTPRKAIAVAPLAVEQYERRWVELATRMSFRELSSLLKANGVGVAGEGYGKVESLILRMTPEQQAILEDAIKLAREQNDHGLKRWQCVEMMCQEWLGTFGDWEPTWPEEAEAALAPPMACAFQQLRAVRAAHRPLTTRESPYALDARILELLEGRRNFDQAFGEVAARISATRVWREVGYANLEDYCRDRLGVSARSFRERVWLERRMCALPLLRQAFGSGRLTYSKALLVAKDATVWDVEERIADAIERTWQQTERESSEAERLRNLAAGIHRVWGPEDVMRTVAIAVASAKSVAEAAGLGEIDSGDALALIAGHFLRVWEAHKTRRPSRRRREVLMRHDGLCAVPGCSLPAEHAHHLEFRSHGGSDDPSNLVGLCAAHHLQGVHQGNLRVSGRAGERLVWEFGDGERWVTVGNDSVVAASRRSDGSRRSGVRGPRASVSGPGPGPGPGPGSGSGSGSGSGRGRGKSTRRGSRQSDRTSAHA